MEKLKVVNSKSRQPLAYGHGEWIRPRERSISASKRKKLFH
jgi:hypothetical protein